MVLTILERNHVPLIYKGFSLECCSSSVIGLSWNVKFVETINCFSTFIALLHTPLFPKSNISIWFHSFLGSTHEAPSITLPLFKVKTLHNLPLYITITSGTMQLFIVLFQKGDVLSCSSSSSCVRMSGSR